MRLWYNTIGNTYFTFFSDFKKHDFLRFFKMTYQKVVKSLKQKFSLGNDAQRYRMVL